MKKLIGIVLLCFTIGACQSFPNPVTTDRLANIESAYGIALSAAVAYRNACANKSIPRTCRSIVVELQAADRAAQSALVTARSFIKEHPFLDAFDVISAAQQAVSTFQTISTVYGVK